MANVLAGFRPVKHLNGSPYNGAVNRYSTPAGETGAINVGDLVILSDTTSVTKYPSIERASGTTSLAPVGVVVGFEPDYSNLNLGNYRAGSTLRVALVCDDPSVIFAVPQDGTGGVIGLASIGLNTALVAGSAATTAPYASAMVLDSSEVNTTNTLPFRIMGFVDSPDNDETSTARPAAVLVRINTHRNDPSIAGV